MRKVSAFEFMTLDGYLKGPGDDISWHKHDAEGSAYAAESLKGGSTLLFGRRTYELMASYWPTPLAAQNDPVVAEAMNKAEKLVFSRTLETAAWSNTRIVKGGLAAEVGRLKQQAGKDMTLLGSGSVLTQLAEQGLLDELQLMVDPLALGQGTPLFPGLKRRLDLKLKGSRTFKSGSVLLTYQPAPR